MKLNDLGLAAIAFLITGTEIVSAAPVVFDYTGGLQTYKILESGPYQISAAGASGGGSVFNTFDYSGGQGAQLSETVTLDAGTQFTILVGGQGTGYGGGGASYVRFDAGLLLVAGGGGGGSFGAFPGGNATGSGGNGSGGAGGAGSQTAPGGGGGGGYSSAGAAGGSMPLFPSGSLPGGEGGAALSEMAAGGTSGGGYGGGGGGAGSFERRGGGGGGLNGGAGAGPSNASEGGTSYDLFGHYNTLALAPAGNGEVIINELPEPSSLMAITGGVVVLLRRARRERAAFGC